MLNVISWSAQPGRCLDMYGANESIVRQIVQKSLCHTWQTGAWGGPTRNSHFCKLYWPLYFLTLINSNLYKITIQFFGLINLFCNDRDFQFDSCNAENVVPFEFSLDILWSEEARAYLKRVQSTFPKYI